MRPKTRRVLTSGLIAGTAVAAGGLGAQVLGKTDESVGWFFVGASVMGLMWAADRYFLVQDDAPEHDEVSYSVKKVEVPSVAEQSPIGLALPLVAVAVKSSEGRIFVSDTPRDLLDYFRPHSGYATFEADRLLKSRIGKWLRLPGTVYDVVGLRLRLSEYVVAGAMVEMHFDEEWRHKLASLHPGAAVSVSGKIQVISKLGVFLENCEL